MRRLVILGVGGLGMLLVGVISIALFMGAGATMSGAAACGLAGGMRGTPGSIQYPLPSGSYVLTSPFGPRWGTLHRGQDMAAPIGTDILAAADGTVVQAGPVSGFGNWIVLDHRIGGALVSTVYGHMYSNGVLVDVGDEVVAGQVIGAVGNEGESTGAHLHFEVWQGGRSGGQAVDPMPWLTEHATPAPSLVISAAGSDLLPSPPTGPQSRLTVDAEIIANVDTIVGVAKGAGLSLRAAVVAVATSAQEAGVHNLDYGDRDSVGLFQQRTSAGWGSIEEIMDPALAAQAFYGVAEHTSNSGLIDIAGWETMPLTLAADSVQRSAFPNGYAQWEQQAAELVEAARDAPPIDSPSGAGAATGCPPALAGGGSGAEGVIP